MNLPVSEPSWALPLAELVVVLLLAALIGLIALPLERPVKTAFVPDDEPSGVKPDRLWPRK